MPDGGDLVLAEFDDGHEDGETPAAVELLGMLETMLAAVPALVDQLDVAASKQAKISSGGKAGKGTAHLKEPVNWGAAAARDALLVEWALWHDSIEEIRRHPKAAEIVAGIGRVVKNGYQAIDRAGTASTSAPAGRRSKPAHPRQPTPSATPRSGPSPAPIRSPARRAATSTRSAAGVRCCWRWRPTCCSRSRTRRR
jgi:hypothetical protein